jgi:hypothetical protein
MRNGPLDPSGDSCHDEENVGSSEPLAPRFTVREPASYEGFDHTPHRFQYESALRLKGSVIGGHCPFAHMWVVW